MPKATTGRARGIAFDRLGVGDPLLLIHGTGGSRSVWRPIVEPLARVYDVIVVDLPGHGVSGDLVAGVAPTPIGYAQALGDLLDDLRLEDAHAVGNSVGGWTALELAKSGRARSVVAFGPAGLWNPRSPKSATRSLRLKYFFGRRFGAVLPLALGNPVTRTILMAQEYGRPWRVPAKAAIEAARTYATTRGFDEHLEQTNRARFAGGRTIDVPVTIAFGTRELLLSRRGRLRDELPAHAEWVELQGCGHIPTWDDPELVVRTIVAGTRPAE
jgi:pimeloyl-ACP methyl ester carboxylesterase